MTINNVAADVKHSLVVEVEGYLKWEKTVQVKEGETLQEPVYLTPKSEVFP